MRMDALHVAMTVIESGPTSLYEGSGTWPLPSTAETSDRASSPG
jgi:hypothetical protein